MLDRISRQPSAERDEGNWDASDQGRLLSGSASGARVYGRNNIDDDMAQQRDG